jgi:N-acylneuraminate cytidylyltransferase
MAETYITQKKVAKTIPSPVELVVFDFDGVFTDNCVYVNEDGSESVRCSRADSLGIARLREKGVPMLILSTERNRVVAARAGKLRIPAIRGCRDKTLALRKYALKRKIDLRKTIYAGNDVNDAAAMELAGFSACPSDAYGKVKEIASLVLTKSGGQGVVRELCDMILAGMEKT